MPRFDLVNRASRGFTLLEIATVLLLSSLTLTALLPAARHQLDRMAVLGAREEVAGLFHRARFEAVARGGATLHLHRDSASVALLSGGEVRAYSDLGGEYGVVVVLSGDRQISDLPYDLLGIGRITSQTIRFSRGRAEAGLVVSSYGRVTRR